MSGMRWSFLGSLTMLAACAGPEVTTQPMKDGSFAVTCRLPMAECLRRVEDRCPLQRFRIIQGVSATHLRDAPPFERAYHVSQLQVVCTGDDRESLPPIADKAAGSPAVAPASHGCSRGETRECVGPGACKGGQACLPDQSGFGDCDCGSTRAAPAPAADAGVPGATPASPSGATDAAVAPPPPEPAPAPPAR